MTKETVFSIPKMDCPSEERLIRMQLEAVSGIKNLKFDISGRTLAVVHDSDEKMILNSLEPLNFGAKIVSTTAASAAALDSSELQDSAGESRVLKQLLAINAIMFFVELGIGFAAQSTGLIADSLDMFADAAVYGMSLYAVGKSGHHKRRAARFSGYIQLVLAVMALSEVVRRAFFGGEPDAPLMMGVSFVALIANVTCMALLAKHREGAVHMKASWIFSTNDVIANLGVIAAGSIVYFTSKQWPDLLIGAIIAIVVLRGALKILKISRPASS